MPLPSPDDRTAWVAIIEGDDWTRIRNEEIVGAFMDGVFENHPRIEDRSIDRLLKQIKAIARRRVGWHHPNQGRDIVDDAVHEVMLELIAPEDPKTTWLRINFGFVVGRRAQDAIRRSTRNPCTTVADLAKKADTLPSVILQHGRGNLSEAAIVNRMALDDVAAGYDTAAQKLIFQVIREGTTFEKLGELLGKSASAIRMSVGKMKANARTEFGRLPAVHAATTPASRAIVLSGDGLPPTPHVVNDREAVGQDDAPHLQSVVAVPQAACVWPAAA